MSTSELDNYKVDHLFLLIGENPLPNYVAAKLLVNKDGTVYLVHTRDTYETANNLQIILREENNNLKDLELISLEDYESDAHYISTEISTKLEKLTNGIIGLNYTGGTKAMSAHSYRTLFYEEIKENNGSNNKKYKQRENIIFTYLDPRNLEMCIDSEKGERERIKIKPTTLEVDLIKLFNLHRLNLTNTPDKEAKLPNLSRAMANLFSNESTRNSWFSGFYKEFCNQGRRTKPNGSTDWRSKTDLMEVSVSIEKLPEEMVTAFKEENFLIDNKLSLKQVQKTNSFAKLKNFCEWLDGLWLEHYVLEEVKKISADKFINKNYGMTFKIPLEGTEKGFEFDVAFTRGYQLFAISCSTTSKRDLCKQKLFEAYLRARQMGGDEARVILICCSNDPDSIKAEIGNLLDQKKIAVFGCEHLTDLSKNIADWISQKDKEAA
ncbi:Card1-like endonuclease domain-containing protein [Nodularia sp. UHCC 0506]|uniref:Card1-like endonuclease domain-containing protein n=1 Tax=Nodularia sp. UHCC 0506 TaxID=3110243 RepID=UPI002B206481|nr:DUF1887 family CARF protein [Nodularia sp. UHCC 0506]MEA5515823.1 DUF1887 family CARF protein [Nodularia sp. UHCC 0506]